MSLVIRNAEAGDAGLIYEFIRELAAFEKLTHEVDASQRDIEEALFGPQPRVFAEIWRNGTARPPGLRSGSTIFRLFEAGTGSISRICSCAPISAPKGVGKALLKNLARRCVTEGLPRLEWWVLNWNEPALRCLSFDRSGAYGRMDGAAGNGRSTRDACRPLTRPWTTDQPRG